MQTSFNTPAISTAPAVSHPAFTWKRSQRVDSLNITVEEYQHNVTGALHYHLSTDNTENVFLVALRTMPMNSTGVAHILEHTALCGSERYPVRDPFFMMIRRSLNTFMNAFTSSDWTAYPFASQNRKDFDNLLNVYLDAVFFARLNELDFSQEGHRIEFERPDDPQSNLVFKGVVFNEMKGSMVSPVNTLWQTLTKHLFPTTTYHYNSGGDPEHIPDLTYEQFLHFYQTHYHPSNAIFMTYGDIPAHEHHEIFEQRALSSFERLDKCIGVNDEKRYYSPVYVREHYALDKKEEDGDKTHIVMGWLLGPSTDLYQKLKTHFLSGVLLDNSSSPLLKALETTDLGSAPSPLCGVEDSNREMTFMCGIEGSKPENVEQVEQLVLGVLNDVASNGVGAEQMEAVLHQLELEQREITGSHYPYGLQLILDGLPSAVHRGDPVAALNLGPVLEQLREDIKNPRFLPDLIRENLLQNFHRVRLTLVPDAGLSHRRQLAEAARLLAIKSQLSEAQKVDVVARAEKLAQRQQQKDDINLLPKVGLEDIPENMHIAQGTSVELGKLPVTLYPQGTNGLVYQQIVMKFPQLNTELLQYLPYYTANLTELGCGGHSYLDTQAWQAAISGGVNIFSVTRGKINNVNDIKGYFILSSKALSRNHKALCQLMQATLEQPRFDEYARIKELIAQQRAHREQSVTGQGHSLAMLAASSGLSATASLNHRLSGLAGIKHTKQLDESLKEKNNLQALAEKFNQLHGSILKTKRQFLLIGEDGQLEEYQSHLLETWRQFDNSSRDHPPLSLPFEQHRTKQMWVTSTPVNFCAKAYPTVPMEHEDAAALSVLAGFLRNGYLHTAIREQGGAYGGGAAYVSDIAAFRFYSYRDPRLSETLQDFDRSIDWLLSEKHEWRQLEEAILGVIGGIDKPSSPSGEAKDAFQNALFGRTPEIRQGFRKRILQVTLEDLKRVGERYFKPENASIAVVAGANAVEKASALDLEVIHI